MGRLLGLVSRASRLAYVELHGDEKAATVTASWSGRGIRVISVTAASLSWQQEDFLRDDFRVTSEHASQRRAAGFRGHRDRCLAWLKGADRRTEERSDDSIP